MPTRVVYGEDTLSQVGEHVKGKVLLVTGGKSMKKIGAVKKITEQCDCFVFDEVEPNPKAETVMKGIKKLREQKCTEVIGLGGGSAIDVAKAVAMMNGNEGNLDDYMRSERVAENRGCRFIAIPSTAGTGSEVTPFSVITDHTGKKLALDSPVMYPDVSLVDPTLTLSCPKKVTAAAGLDALTHAMESYWSKNNPNPISHAYALRAIKLIYWNLKKAYEKGDDFEARKGMMLGSMYAGMAFSNTGVTTCHTVSNALNFKYNVDHGIGCALFLPTLMRYNFEADKRISNIARAMGAQSVADAANKLEALMRSMGVPTKLSQIGVGREDIADIAKNCFSSSRANNPRDMNDEELQALLGSLL